MALFPEDREALELDCEVVQVRLAELTLHAPRQWGACWPAPTLWDRLELDRFWGPRLPASREGTRWLDLLKIQVCHRLIDPGSISRSPFVRHPKCLVAFSVLVFLVLVPFRVHDHAVHDYPHSPMIIRSTLVLQTGPPHPRGGRVDSHSVQW